MIPNKDDNDKNEKSLDGFILLFYEEGWLLKENGNEQTRSSGGEKAHQRGDVDRSANAGARQGPKRGLFLWPKSFCGRKVFVTEKFL